MDIKLHPQTKALLEDLNSRKQVFPRPSGKVGYQPGALKRGGGDHTLKLKRRDLEGRGGPL